MIFVRNSYQIHTLTNVLYFIILHMYVYTLFVRVRRDLNSLQSVVVFVFLFLILNACARELNPIAYIFYLYILHTIK